MRPCVVMCQSCDSWSFFIPIRNGSKERGVYLAVRRLMIRATGGRRHVALHPKRWVRQAGQLITVRRRYHKASTTRAAATTRRLPDQFRSKREPQLDTTNRVSSSSSSSSASHTTTRGGRGGGERLSHLAPSTYTLLYLDSAEAEVHRVSEHELELALVPVAVARKPAVGLPSLGHRHYGDLNPVKAPHRQHSIGMTGINAERMSTIEIGGGGHDKR